MKIKILLVPSIIALSIILSIWVVYPAYSNGTDGVKEKAEELKVATAKLTDIQGKSGHVANLSSSLENMLEKDVLYEFVPDVAKEEEIFDAVNFFASNAGLAIYGVTINQAKETEDALEMYDKESVPAPLPVEQKIHTELKMAGDYEKIKEFLGRMEKFDRHNDFVSLEIGKNSIQENKEADPNVLVTTISMDFDVLKKAKLSDVNVENAVFSKDSLDTGIISEIQNIKERKSFEINIGDMGKVNPFIP